MGEFFIYQIWLRGSSCRLNQQWQILGESIQGFRVLPWSRKIPLPIGKWRRHYNSAALPLPRDAFEDLPSLSGHGTWSFCVCNCRYVYVCMCVCVYVCVYLCVVLRVLEFAVRVVGQQTSAADRSSWDQWQQHRQSRTLHPCMSLSLSPSVCLSVHIATLFFSRI